MIPELWLVGNIVTVRLTRIHLDKYKHLLQWKKSESILEFGCGDGQVSEKLLLPVLPKDYKEYVAMDNSKEMLDHYKQHVNIPRLQAVHRDISTKPLETCWRSRFDHVFGLFVMHMVQNPRSAIENIQSMLKPGGQAFLTFFERMPVHKTFEALEKHPKWGKYGTFLSNYNTNSNPKLEYESDLKAAGFKNYVIHAEEPVGCTFDDEESYKKLYISVNKMLPKIPDEDKDEYIKDYLNEVERQGYPLVFNEESGKRIPTLYVKIQAFININNMLKPGGQAFLSFFERAPADHAFHNLLQYPKWSRYGHMLSAHYYSENVEESYKKDIDAAGFKSYTFDVEKDYAIWHESVEERRAGYVSVNIILPRIPEELRDEYLRDYIKEIESGGHILSMERDGKQKTYTKANLFITVMDKYE